MAPLTAGAPSPNLLLLLLAPWAAVPGALGRRPLLARRGAPHARREIRREALLEGEQPGARERRAAATRRPVASPAARPALGHRPRVQADVECAHVCSEGGDVLAVPAPVQPRADLAQRGAATRGAATRGLPLGRRRGRRHVL